MGLDAPTIYQRKFVIDTIMQLAAPGALQTTTTRQNCGKRR